MIKYFIILLVTTSIIVMYLLSKKISLKYKFHIKIILIFLILIPLCIYLSIKNTNIDKKYIPPKV